VTVPYSKVHVVVNPASGKDRPILNTLHDVFVQYGFAREMGIPKLLSLESSAAGFHYWQGWPIHIEAKPPKTTWTDGKYLGQAPVTFQVVPAALAVVVPSK
jgi:hypothetical protein